MEVRAMSSETRQRVEELLALAPWIAFVIALAWFRLLELRDSVRTSRVDETEHVRQRESESNPRR
jgi:hypothetical protein